MSRQGMFLMILFLLPASPASAMEVGGVVLPDTLSVNGRELVLNGAGLRKKFFVEVYAMGLYLTGKTRNAEKIIREDEPMAARMRFVYDGVAAEDLVDAWREGFENVTGGDLGSLQERLDTFNGYFTAEAGEGDVYEFVYVPGEGVRTVLEGRTAGIIPGLDFKQALFGVWLGKRPADATLKQGLLGR